MEEEASEDAVGAVDLLVVEAEDAVGVEVLAEALADEEEEDVMAVVVEEAGEAVVVMGEVVEDEEEVAE